MRIAIVGGGSVGSRHAANARALGHDVTVFDTDQSRGQVWPVTFTGAARLCASDAVMICTPAHTHAWAAVNLLELDYQGPLFVEKPLDVASDSPVFTMWPHPVTMVGYNWRFHPTMRLFVDMARGGGTLHFDCRTDMRSWPGSSYGDPLLECSHEIDLACAALGHPRQITGGELDGGGAWVQMIHERGDSIVDVRWQSDPWRRASLYQRGLSVTGRWNVERGNVDLAQSYMAELQHFLAAVESGQPTICPFSQGLRVVEICEQVKRLCA